MEHFGAIFDGEMCSEEAEFMAQLLGNCSVPTHESNKNVVRVLDASEMYSFPFSSHDQSYLSSGSNNLFDDLMTMDYSMMEDTKDHTCMDHDHMMLKQDVSNAKRSRVPNYEVQRVKSNKRLKVDETNDDDNNNKNNNNKASVRGRKTNSSCCSEDDSNNGVTSSSTSKVNESKKTRANRGSATDPQSLYARKRREKINERLRILQKLVPNGTKVDISTMLEEAVEYVKFLQVQIKLLSSDDMWMYAPIAYNGMGLDLTKSLS